MRAINVKQLARVCKIKTLAKFVRVTVFVLYCKKVESIAVLLML
jgi:hypothetical protein